jgi:hypothetical protein
MPQKNMQMIVWIVFKEELLPGNAGWAELWTGGAGTGAGAGALLVGSALVAPVPLLAMLIRSFAFSAGKLSKTITLPP